MIARDFPSVRCIASSRNLGFAGGVNAGRRHATGQYLLLLNPDAEPRAGALERLVSTLEHDRALGAAAGRLVDADGRTQVGFNVRRLPTLPSLLCDLLFVARLWPGNPASSRYYARDLDQDAPADVEQPAAAALMVRADRLRPARRIRRGLSSGVVGGRGLLPPAARDGTAHSLRSVRDLRARRAAIHWPPDACGVPARVLRKSRPLRPEASWRRRRRAHPDPRADRRWTQAVAVIDAGLVPSGPAEAGHSHVLVSLRLCLAKS